MCSPSFARSSIEKIKMEVENNVVAPAAPAAAPAPAKDLSNPEFLTKQK